jgi:hypothetical protein
MLAVLLQAAAVVRAAFSLAVASAVVLLADYAVAAVISPGARGAVAVALGSGLFLAAELAAWSVDLAGAGSEPAHLVRRRVGTLAALVLGSWLSTRSNLRPARSARRLHAGSVRLGHPWGGRRGGDRS